MDVFTLQKPSFSLSKKIADIHVDEAEEDLLSKVGKRFLGDYVYPAFFNDPDVIVNIASDGDRTVGFCVITISLKKTILKMLKRNYLKTFWVFITEIVFRPHLWRPLLSSLRIDSPASDNKTAEIFMIAVAKEFQNSGIGASLLKNLEEELRKRGIKGCIARVRKSSIAAVNMYKKASYSIIKNVSFNNTGWYWMIKSI